MKKPGYRGVGGRGAVWNRRSDRSHNIYTANRCANPSVMLAPGRRVDAAEISKALGGRKSGRGWSARCPAHDDRTPSLSFQDADDGRLLVFCHAGCGQGQVIAALEARGLWPKTIAHLALHRMHPSSIDRNMGQDDGKRAKAALDIWNACEPARGTLVETYLASRRISLEHDVDGVIRFHPALKLEGSSVSGMVALFRDIRTNAPCGIHRTFIDHSGQKIGRKMLGRTRDAAIKLDADESVTLGLHIGEGVETCLSARLAGFRPVWALGSVSAITSFPELAGIEAITVLGEVGDGGANQRAASVCAARWCNAGCDALAVVPLVGDDLNDVWQEVAL
jgi:putative DNA primase/helicase